MGLVEPTSTTPACRRSAGVLLHPTSLPGPWGLGDLGDPLLRFLDFLADAGQHYWQVLPLGPTYPGSVSPYSSSDVRAGNPLLVSPERLHESGLLSRAELDRLPTGVEGRADFPLAARARCEAIRLAWDRVAAGGRRRRHFDDHVESQRDWLEDFALHAALRERHGTDWHTWESSLGRRSELALGSARAELREEITRASFVQYLFAEQWGLVRKYARDRGVEIVGDLPYYTVAGSAAGWRNPEVLDFDAAAGRARRQAGVPPDYFSDDGQMWRYPVYKWDVLEEEGFRWWIDRFAGIGDLVDVVRLDHFRGYESYWAIAAGASSARDGKWVSGPGSALFSALETHLGRPARIWAEDQGTLTPAVERLRDRWRFPGQRILQFGFRTGPAARRHRLKHHVESSVVYTSTHDTSTLAGWLAGLDPATRGSVLRTAGEPSLASNWPLIALAHSSVSAVAMVSMQDLLGVDDFGRMNRPGRTSDEWGWRYLPEQLHRPHRRETSRRYRPRGTELTTSGGQPSNARRVSETMKAAASIEPVRSSTALPSPAITELQRMANPIGADRCLEASSTAPFSFVTTGVRRREWRRRR